MRSIVVVAASLILCYACSANRRVMASPDPQTKLNFVLSADNNYFVGEPLKIKFELRNLNDVPVYVLKWYTPLEGIWGDEFRVRRDGEELPYNGPMAKRGDPQAADYVEIGPKGAVSADVNLALAYDFSKPGPYRVEFSGKLWDVVPNKDLVPRPRSKQQALKIDGNAVSFRVVQR